MASGIQQRLASWRLGIILFSLSLGMLLLALDITVIATAIPRISTDFEALNDLGWFGSTYLLSMTASQPIFGNVYKLFNVKIAYLASVVIFEGRPDLSIP